MARLRKSDAETLVAAIDSPLLVDALRAALSRICDVEPFDDDWPALVRLAGHRGGWGDERVASLIGRDLDQLTALALELNELRDVNDL
jgi:hypothetical protein